jgi:hypothetical protein
MVAMRNVNKESPEKQRSWNAESITIVDTALYSKNGLMQNLITQRSPVQIRALRHDTSKAVQRLWANGLI